MGHTELILGGQKSGKSRAALARARQLFNSSHSHVTMVATAKAWDQEMAERIDRHRQERHCLGIRFPVLEVGPELPQVLNEYSGQDQLMVIDCLTLWLTQLMFPVHKAPTKLHIVNQVVSELLTALQRFDGSWIVVSNEASLGIIPVEPAARQFIDQAGYLHREIALMAKQVTLMVAGIEMPIKRDKP